jgi:hypothetical protein
MELASRAARGGRLISHDHRPQLPGVPVGWIRTMCERIERLSLLLALLLALVPMVRAQTPGNPSAPQLITQPIVESNLVTLTVNVRPEANAANDRGPVPDVFAMGHMFWHCHAVGLAGGDLCP